MDRDALWQMQLVVATVDEGTIAGAARRMRVTPSAVSKHLLAVERRIGVRLIQRTTRSLRVTEAGARYIEQARAALAAVEAVEARASSEQSALKGPIRISAPTLLGQELLAPVIARFVKTFPEVHVDLDLADRFVDVVSEPIDVAVRIARRLPSAEYIVRRIGEIRWVLVASTQYLAEHKRLRRLEDLAEHACLELRHADDRGRWRFVRNGKQVLVSVRGPLTCSNLIALRHAIRQGVGIAQVPTYLVTSDLASGRLVTVFPRSVLESRALFLVQPSRAFVPHRVRALCDVLARELPIALIEGPV